MAKSLTEMVAEIVTAQASQGPMEIQAIELMIKKTFQAFREISDKEGPTTIQSHGLIPAAVLAEAGIPMQIPSRKKEQGIAKTDASETQSKSGGPQKEDPMLSIGEDKVTCLECGQKFKQLSHTHLRGHGLTPKEYRKKHGFPAKQPLTARVVSERRKSRAKQIGLGNRLKLAREKKLKQ